MRRKTKESIQMTLIGVAFGAGILASFLFLGLRAKAAPSFFSDLASIDRQEIADMRAAEPWEAPAWVCPYSESELDLLAAIVYAEAGDQGFRGMQLVCDVILNRIDKGWGNSISSVVYQPGQFSPVTDGGLDRAWSRVTQECYEACMAEIMGPRINYDIQYFSMYGCANGVFAFQYLDHYFGY